MLVMYVFSCIKMSDNIFLINFYLLKNMYLAPEANVEIPAFTKKLIDNCQCEGATNPSCIINMQCLSCDAIYL